MCSSDLRSALDDMSSPRALRYDPRRPESVAAVQSELMRRFGVSRPPPLVYEEPGPARRTLRRVKGLLWRVRPARADLGSARP